MTATGARAAALVATTIALEIGAAAVRLSDGEIRGLPRFLVPFQPWKSGAYQRSMHGTVFDGLRHVLHFVLRLSEALYLFDLFSDVGVLSIVAVRCAAIAGGLDGFLHVLVNDCGSHDWRRRNRSCQVRESCRLRCRRGLLCRAPRWSLSFDDGARRRPCRRARRRRSCSESA